MSYLLATRHLATDSYIAAETGISANSFKARYTSADTEIALIDGGNEGVTRYQVLLAEPCEYEDGGQLMGIGIEEFFEHLVDAKSFFVELVQQN